MFLLLKHRQVLLEIFSKNYRVRRNMIQSRLTQECGEDLSKQEVDKVLKVRPFHLEQPEASAAHELVHARSVPAPCPRLSRRLMSGAFPATLSCQSGLQPLTLGSGAHVQKA